MIKHFVTFYSPGTFVSERTIQEIPEWDVREAVKRASKITERYNSRPYGFRFHTEEGGDGRWEPKRIGESGTHYINGKLETLAEFEARNDPGEEILRSNMRGNDDWKTIVRGVSGWKWTMSFENGDVLVNADGMVVKP